MKHWRAITVLAISALLVFPQATLALDLHECLKVGLANSDRVLAARASMDQRQTDRYASVPNFFPQVSLQASYMWLDVHSTMPDLAIHLPEGMPEEQAAMFGSLLGEFDPLLDLMTEVPDYNRGMKLQAYQPLTQLPQIAMYDRMAADASKLAALNYGVTKDQITLFLASQYLQALIAEKKMETLRRASEQMNQLIKDGLALRSHGMITEADYLKIQMHQGEVELQLRQALSDEAYFKSYLAKLLNLPLDQIILEEPVPPVVVAHDLTWCLDQGEQNRRELQMTSLQEGIARSNRTASYMNLFPQIGAVAAADWADDGLDATPDRTYSAGVVLSWNFWGMGRDVLQARSSAYALSRAEHEARATRIDLRMSIEKAWHDAQLAHEAVATHKRILDQARENFRIEGERYRLGQTTTSDLLGAQTQLTSAQTGHDAARFMAILADETLVYAVGQHPFSYLLQADGND